MNKAEEKILWKMYDSAVGISEDILAVDASQHTWNSRQAVINKVEVIKLDLRKILSGRPGLEDDE